MTFRTKDSMSIHVMFWLTLQARIVDANMNLDSVINIRFEANILYSLQIKALGNSLR